MDNEKNIDTGKETTASLNNFRSSGTISIYMSKPTLTIGQVSSPSSNHVKIQLPGTIKINLSDDDDDDDVKIKLEKSSTIFSNQTALPGIIITNLEGNTHMKIEKLSTSAISSPMPGTVRADMEGNTHMKIEKLSTSAISSPMPGTVRADMIPDDFERHMESMFQTKHSTTEQKPPGCSTDNKYATNVDGHNNEMNCPKKEKDEDSCSEEEIVIENKVGNNNHRRVIRYRRSHCTFCWEHFKTKGQLRKHLMMNHKDSIPAKFGCVPCSRAFYYEKEFIKHFRYCKYYYLQDTIYPCEKCDKKFVNRNHMLQHVKAKHEEAESKSFPCSLCGKTFRKQRILDFHISTHRELWQSCGVCKRPFRRPIDLKKHLLTHDNKVPYFCHMCKEGFTEKNQFKKHKKQFHKKSGKYQFNNRMQQ